MTVVRRDQDVRDLLGTLMVAHGPVARADLLALWPEMEWGFDEVLEAVRRFVVQRAAQPDDGPASGSYALCHPRFQAYLVTHKLPRQMAHYRERLLASCARWPAHQSRYALRHYSTHLYEAKQHTPIYALARDATFRQAQHRAFPAEPDLPLLTVQTALRSAADTDQADLMAAFLLHHAHQVGDLQQERRLDALRAGSLARAHKLADLADPERRVLWYLLLVWELYDSGRGAEAAERLTTLDKRRMPRLGGGQAIIAAALLTHLLGHTPTAVAPLARQIVGDANALGTVATAQAGAGQVAEAVQTALRSE